MTPLEAAAILIEAREKCHEKLWFSAIRYSGPLRWVKYWAVGPQVDSMEAELQADFSTLAALHAAEVSRALLDTDKLLREAAEVIRRYADGTAYEFDRQIRGEVSFNMTLSSATARDFLKKLEGCDGNRPL